ncbi:hypothetical protein BAE44_0013622 [Dichanthelium oligosanthes]|uniref:Uncharacterized protein n=1 Tax=Dichanthelium oligosanthes TaxID=888268 RepID=A0A1E5VJQ7_9POAL|nr:hypothetical protein BAE44_0013622 [Dichanthelium oligosanthes]
MGGGGDGGGGGVALAQELEAATTSRFRPPRSGPMADDDCDGLPTYFEDAEEEVAAEKLKRRQQSQKPRGKLPWEDATPEEKARSALRLAMMSKLYEYDPKLGYGCYNRVWFVDLEKNSIAEVQ